MATRSKKNSIPNKTKPKQKPIQKIYKCALCRFSTKYPGPFKNHVKSHSAGPATLFNCPECPYKSKSKSKVQVHLTNVHRLRSASPSSRPFPCPHPGCNYAAKDKSHLKRHSKTHSTEKSLVCPHPNCNYSTNCEQNLAPHMRSHSGVKPFVCPFESCSYAAKTSSHLVRHTRTHTKERPFKCPEQNCEYAAKDISHLKRHGLTKHPKPHEGEEGEEGTKSPSFKCPLCEYSTNYELNLTNHIKRHTLEKFFKCDEPQCNFEAKTKAEVKQHKIVHSDEKPFHCSVESCGYRCKTTTALSRHSVTHSDTLRYKCELCPFRARNRITVRKHLNRAHSSPDSRPFKCPKSKCYYAAKTKPCLKSHLLTHKGEKKHSCSFPDCEYKAIRKPDVQNHERQKHNVKHKEKCRICLATFKTKAGLKRHMKAHRKKKL